MKPLMKTQGLLVSSLAIVCLGIVGCDLFALFLPDLPAGAAFDFGAGTVRLRVENQSGLEARVDAQFVLDALEVHRTSRLVGIAGASAVSEVVWTRSDVITARAIISDTASIPANILLQPGDVLAEAEFRIGIDFFDGQTVTFVIPAPEPAPPSVLDCNGNGRMDGEDIEMGASEDCNGNDVPDECEADGDGDGVIDDCDNCIDTANPGQNDRDQNGTGDMCDKQACCLGQNVCIDALEADCLAQSGGSPQGPGTFCNEGSCFRDSELQSATGVTPVDPNFAAEQ